MPLIKDYIMETAEKFYQKKKKIKAQQANRKHNQHQIQKHEKKQQV